MTTKALHKVKNKDAEMAFEMAMKLAGNELAQDEGFYGRVWDKCHTDQTIQSLVVRYLVSTSAYAPKALYNLHTRLAQLINTEGAK
jgi:hypothetical protein